MKLFMKGKHASDQRDYNAVLSQQEAQMTVQNVQFQACSSQDVGCCVTVIIHSQ